MPASLAVAVLALACLGAGAGLLRVLGILPRLNDAERIGWSFTLGFGLLGWVVFWPALAGILSPAVIGLCCIPGVVGLLALHRLPRPDSGPGGAIPWRLWAAAACLLPILAGDVLEALAPPADADSLAYHFALPRHMLAAGHLLFIERALDSTAPQLVQMTYTAALALGGERGLTLWCMLSGWSVGLLVFGLARRHLPADWALALAAATLGLPAMLYGAGTGQVEARLASLILVAITATMEARRRGEVRWAAAAGLAAGFLAASKYTGLLPAAVCGLFLLGRSGSLRLALGFGLALLAAGSQWYGWNAWNTGDPVFPMLYGRLPYAAGTHWNAAQAEFMARSLTPMEMAVPRSLGWWLAYPLSATLDGHPIFESGRTGFGLLPLLLLPFAAAAGIGRREAWRHPLTLTAGMVMLAYTLWFFLGPSQRVRHLLPLLPPLLVALGTGAAVAARRWRLDAPIWCGIALVLALQAGGQAVFAAKFVRYQLQGADRDAFLNDNVNFYALARWLNHHLGPGDRVLLASREIDYLVTVPSFQANPYIQSVIEVRPDNNDPHRFLAQLRRQGITHVVTGPEHAFGGGPEVPHRMAQTLAAAGCAEGPEGVEAGPPSTSRTLEGRRGPPSRFFVFRLKAAGTCRLDTDALPRR